MFSQWCSFGCLDEGLKGVCLSMLRNGQTEWNLKGRGRRKTSGWDGGKKLMTAKGQPNAMPSFDISSGLLRDRL